MKHAVVVIVQDVILEMLNGCSPTTLRMVLRSSLGSVGLKRLYEQGLSRVAGPAKRTEDNLRTFKEVGEQSGGTDYAGTVK